MRTAFRIVAIIIILISGWILWSDSSIEPITSEISGEFADAFEQFKSSAYLQSLWNEVCAYPLAEENVVLIVAVDERGDKPELRCQWRDVPVGIDEKAGIEIEESVTDVNAEWLRCGFDDEFAEEVRSAVHKPGSARVHLGSSPGKHVSLSYVLIGKCHFWDEYYCEEYDGGRICELENSGDILSVAYAVLDPQTHTTFW